MLRCLEEVCEKTSMAIEPKESFCYLFRNGGLPRPQGAGGLPRPTGNTGLKRNHFGLLLVNSQ